MSYDIEKGGYGDRGYGSQRKAATYTNTTITQSSSYQQSGFMGANTNNSTSNISTATSNRDLRNSNGNNNGNNYGGGGEDPLVSAIKENIKQMSSNVTSIQRCASLLGTNRDGSELRDKLSGTIESTKVLARDTAAQLKQLSSHSQVNNQTKIIHQKLTKDFSVWLQEFQETSKTSAQKERTLLPPKQPPPQLQQQQLQGGGYNSTSRIPDTFPQGNGNYEDYHSETEKQSLLESSRKQQLMQLENEREFNDALIQDRENGIKQIESAVTEVNEIFTDLANLVHEQGFMIDNIESNIESTAVQTKAAVGELQQASKHQRSARSKMCILAVILSVIAAIVTLILVLSLKK